MDNRRLNGFNANGSKHNGNTDNMRVNEDTTTRLNEETNVWNSSTRRNIRQSSLTPDQQMGKDTWKNELLLTGGVD